MGLCGMVWVLKGLAASSRPPLPRRTGISNGRRRLGRRPALALGR